MRERSESLEVESVGVTWRGRGGRGAVGVVEPARFVVEQGAGEGGEALSLPEYRLVVLHPVVEVTHI